MPSTTSKTPGSTTVAVGAKADPLETLLKSLSVAPKTGLQPMVAKGLSVAEPSGGAAFDEADRYASALAALIFNLEDPNANSLDLSEIERVIARIDEAVNHQLNRVVHSKEFTEMERSWRSLQDLMEHTDFSANIRLDFLDVLQEELQEDLEGSAIDISKAAIFNKVYTAEYDQYGGAPFGAMVGLYEFNNTPADLTFLRLMGKVASAAHCPFVSSVGARFFGFEKAEDFAEIKDVAGLMSHPKYNRWQSLRDSDEAAYLGLAFPRYVLRLPFNAETNPAKGLSFNETVGSAHKAANPPGTSTPADRNDDGYLWGNPAVLVARNMARSFSLTGWCQSLRGPRAGGLVDDLPVHTFIEGGEELLKMPVEVALADYKELELANNGLMPLVYKKDSGVAAFFSAQSAKVSHRFKDAQDSENSQLVTNLAYTMSVTRVAHYVKSIMRDTIGTNADEAYIQKMISSWLNDYVTAVVGPDSLTMSRFPFKAATVEVEKRAGQIGFFDCTISLLPHIQFEGMDVELRLETRLG